VSRSEIRPELDDDVAAGRKGEVQAIGVGHLVNSRMKGSKESAI
jgi:hypothetical protein